MWCVCFSPGPNTTMVQQLQTKLNLAPHICKLGVVLLRYLIILAIVSGSNGSNDTTAVPATPLLSSNGNNTTTVPTSTHPPESESINTSTVPVTTLLPSTNTPRVDDTPQPTETKEIIEVITETIEYLYTDIPPEKNEATELQLELANQPFQTTQLSDIVVTERTRISTTTLMNNVVTTQSTVSSTPTGTVSSQRPQTSPTLAVPHSTHSPPVTTPAQNSSVITSSKQTTLNSNFTTKVTTTPSSIITSKAVTPTSNVTTSNSVSTIPSITNNTSTSNYVTSKLTTPRVSTTSRVTTLNSTVSSKATTLPNPQVEINVTTTAINQTTVSEHPSSSANTQRTKSTYSTSTESIYIPNSTESNSISTVYYSTTENELVKTTPSIADGQRDELFTSTNYDFRENVTSILYVEERDDLPILLIVIASTVAVLVTLLLLFFVIIFCVARKRQQRKNAKYYDYKKRWVKRAPRPKYEKVKQSYRHDREAAGSGWVFRDGADPSKQITLELRPRNTQSSPEDISNIRNSNPGNFEEALSESFPPDMLSSPEVAVNLDGDSIGSLRLSKSLDRADRSTSSEGDSGILALGEDAWSPTKGVPFHFISDDAVIEL